MTSKFTSLIAECRYNGLGYRITWKYDADNDNDVDGSDKKFHLAYDERWPKVQFVYHAAGADGQCESRYTDVARMSKNICHSGNMLNV